MLHILLLMLLIGGTSQTSGQELKRHRERTVSTTSADSGCVSPTKNFPADLPKTGTERLQVHVERTITGPLSALKQYFTTKPENGVLTLAVNTDPGSRTFRPVISSIDDEKYLVGVTTVIIGMNNISPYHIREIHDDLKAKGIQFATQC